MIVIEPKVHVEYPMIDPLTHIEKIGRTCYKSEDKIGPGTAVKFIGNLISRKHMAMLEHYNFAIQVSFMTYAYISGLDSSDHNWLKYINMTDVNGRYIVSSSIRGWRELYEISAHPCVGTILNFLAAEVDPVLIKDMDIAVNGFEPEMKLLTIPELKQLSMIERLSHIMISIHFTCDRGVTHEMVRHRPASFAQESTRYCNYGKPGEITVIKPCFWEEDSDEYCMWIDLQRASEKVYLSLIQYGAQAQEARDVLTNSLKTEIWMSALLREWVHFSQLRAIGTTGKPHPQMQQVAKPAYDWFSDFEPAIFMPLSY